MLILWILLFSILGSIGAIITASVFLVVKKQVQETLIPCLVSYATGTLLAAGLLGMIPHALNESSPSAILPTVLFGIMLFFILEKSVIWRHCHDKDCEVHGASGPLILIGDAFHNLVDGIVIAAAFLSSIPIGIAVGISVIAHEIPQEVGDLGILLQGGYSKRTALKLNIASGLSTLPGAVVGYYALEIIHDAVPFIMAISAASFLYIALTDLCPGLHRKIGFGRSVRQILLMLIGIGTISVLLTIHP